MIPHQVTYRRVPARIAVYAVLLVALAVALIALSSTSAGSGSCWERAPRCERLDQIRSDHGVRSLKQRRDLQNVAEMWAERMASTRFLAHNPNLLAQTADTVVGENVGYGPDWQSVFAAFMDSPPHRANMLDPDWTRVGVGAHRGYDRVWIVIVFGAP